MSSTGTGYDLEASTFSPDGRIFQTEYATKAVDNGGTTIGLRGKDCVVIAVEKFVTSKLYEPSSNPRVFTVADHVAMGATGLYPDAKALAQFCAGEAVDYYEHHRENMPCPRMIDRLSQYIHAYTLYGMVRPFGCCVFLGSWDELNGPQLFMVDPSGVWYSYYGWAMGKGRQAAKTEIEKLKLSEMGAEELVRESVRILHTIRDQTKDKNVVLDICWAGKHTGGRSQVVPSLIVDEAESYAKRRLSEDSDTEMQT